jgi:hypothetical protein
MQQEFTAIIRQRSEGSNKGFHDVLWHFLWRELDWSGTG